MSNEALELTEKEQKKAEKARLKAEKALEKENERKQKQVEKEKARELKKAQKAAEKLEKQKQKEASKMPIQNDIRRPKAETRCGQIWNIVDKISAQMGQPAPVKYVLAEGVENGFDENTIKTQYARWRKFNGVTGRILPPKAKEAA